MMIYIPGGARRAARAEREHQEAERRHWERCGPYVLNTGPLLKALAVMTVLALVAIGFWFAGMHTVGEIIGFVAFFSCGFTPMGVPKYPDWQGKDDPRR